MNSKRFARALLLLATTTSFAACSAPGAESPADAKTRLEKDTGVSWVVTNPSPFVTHLRPRTPPPPTLINGTTADIGARNFLTSYAALFGIKNVAGEIDFDGLKGPDALGVTHALFHQHAGNAIIEGGRAGVHFDAHGRISWVALLYVPNLDSLNTAPMVDGPTALTTAQADMTTRFPLGTLGAAEMTPAPTLTIVPSATPALSWRMRVSYTLPETILAPVPAGITVTPLRQVMDYLVDANSGAILEATSGLKTEDTATGRGVLYYQQMKMDDTKSFLVVPSGGQWQMYRNGGDTQTMILARASGLPVFTSAHLDPFDSLMPNPGSHVDAYYNFGLIDQHWQAVNRSSYDNAAAPIKLILNDPTAGDQNNAWWDEISAFHFSADNSGGRVFAAALDVCGHEFQHAINQKELNLKYERQSGALDESLADCFGQFIEHEFNPDPVNNVLVSEVQPPVLRNLADPTATMQPDYFTDYQDIGAAMPTSGNDFGHVHANAGIPSKAWWLITVGGTHSHSMVTTQGLGWAASEALYYSTISAQPPVTTFADFAEAMTEQANNVGDDGTTLQTTVCAWYAVGVISKDAVQNDYDNIDCGDSGDGGMNQGKDAGMDLARSDAMDGSMDGSVDGSTDSAAPDGAMDLSMDLSMDLAMDLSMDLSVDAARVDAAGDSGTDASVDMSTCTPVAADFEGMQVMLTGINGEFPGATMTFTKVLKLGSPAKYMGSFGGPEGGNPMPLSTGIPPSATVFTYGDSMQDTGIVGFPAIFNGSNFANQWGRSSLIAVWQDNIGNWQWAWNASGDSFNNGGGFPQWHEYQFVYDSRMPAMMRTRYDVFLGGNAMPGNWTFIRTAPLTVSVTFAGKPSCALPGL